MRSLIVNADDFGLSPGVNRGILRAHREGIVTSASLMVNMEYAAEAVALAKGHPSLAVGLHLTLTAGRPLAPGVSSLTDPEGRFLRGPALAERARPEELEREVRAQVAAFQATGLPLSHIDSHHHLHMEAAMLRPILQRVAAELGVPVRSYACPFSSAFYGQDQVTPEALLAILRELPPGLSELMTHPAELDEHLPRLSSYCEERSLELATLTSPRVREALQMEGWTLTTYGDAKGLMR